MNTSPLVFAFFTQGLWFLALALGLALLLRSEKIRHTILSQLKLHLDSQNFTPPRARKLKSILLFSGASLLIVAAMGPQYGQKDTPMKSQSMDICLAIDLSRSMLAEDLSPNRLQVAKDQLSLFLPRLGGDQVALVGYAGSAYLAAPLTNDYAALVNFMSPMNPDFISDPSTDADSALARCLQVFGLDDSKLSDQALAEQDAARVVMLVGDGEDTVPRSGLGPAAQTLIKNSIPIFTFGVGLSDKVPIPIRDRNGQVRGYLQDPETGQSAQTRLDGEGLQTLAEQSGGRYYTISDGFRVWVDFERRLSNFKRDSRETGTRRSLEHRFQIPLLLAFLLLLLEFFIPETGRLRAMRKQNNSSNKGIMSLFFIVLMVCAFAQPNTAHSQSTPDSRPTDPLLSYRNNQVNKWLRENNRTRALKDMQEALERDASRYDLRFNWATTLMLNSFEVVQNPRQGEAPIRIDKQRLHSALREFNQLEKLFTQQDSSILSEYSARYKELLYQRAFAHELNMNFDQGLKDLYRAQRLEPQNHPLAFMIQESIKRLLLTQEQAGQSGGQGDPEDQDGEGQDSNKGEGEFTNPKDHQSQFSGTDISEEMARQILESVQAENQEVQERKARRESQSETKSIGRPSGKPW